MDTNRENFSEQINTTLMCFLKIEKYIKGYYKKIKFANDI